MRQGAETALRGKIGGTIVADSWRLAVRAQPVVNVGATPPTKTVPSYIFLRRLVPRLGGSRSPDAMNDKDALKNDATKTDKRKQSLYFPESMLQEIKEEAARLDRSLSWVVQRAWKISRMEIKKLPSVNEVDGGDDDDEA